MGRMILTHSKGKTKALCECGAQGPNLPDEAFGSWKRSEKGREFYSHHMLHGKARVVEAGGRRVSLEEDIQKIESKRTKASKKEIDDLVDHFNRSDG